jgi:hypothetical protein
MCMRRAWYRNGDVSRESNGRKWRCVVVNWHSRAKPEMRGAARGTAGAVVRILFYSPESVRWHRVPSMIR